MSAQERLGQASEWLSAPLKWGESSSCTEALIEGHKVSKYKYHGTIELTGKMPCE